MQNSVKRLIWGFLFVGVLGTLFHFAYEWLGETAIAGLFFPINESIWEHLKLLYFSVALWWIVEGFLGVKEPRFFASRVWALSLALLFIPVAHYTYSGIVGQRFAWVDIGIYFVAAAVYFLLQRRFSAREKEESEGENILAAVVFLVWMFSFFAFTFLPPNLAIFQAP
ncbi:MAG: hypothetical protein J6B54_00170 [Clostridia bacterium]|nr:hypothetical protein [Clostridia bacterium]